MNVRFFPPVALAAMLVAMPAMAQERVLTLPEAVTMALDAHPAIEAARLDLQAAREREGVALAGFLPQVGLVANYSRTTGNYASRPGQNTTSDISKPTTNDNTTYNYFNFGVTLDQPIWDFGRTLGAWHVAQYGTASAREGIAVSRLDLWSRVVAAYYAVLATQRMVSVATRTRDAVARHAQVAEAFYKVGSRPRLDMVRAQASARAADAALGVATERLDLAKSALLTAMGRSDRFHFEVANIDAGPAEPLVPLEESVEQARANRPERARLELAIKAAEAEVTRAMGDWFPILSAGATFTDGGTRISELAWNWGVGVGLTYPVFSGLATWRGYRAAKANLEALKVRLQEYDLGVRAEVEQARLRLVETMARLPPLEAALAAANEALHLAEERYKAGEGNAVEFMDARKGASDAETELVQAQFDVGMASTALQRALGALPQAYRAAAE